MLCGSDLSLHSFPISHKKEPSSKNEESDQSKHYVGLILVCTLFLYPIKRSLTEKNEDSDQSQRYVGLI